MNGVLLFGGGSYSTTVSRLAQDCGHRVVGCIDDLNTGNNVLGTLSEVVLSHPPDQYSVAVAIGYNDLAARKAAYERLKATGYSICTLIHPNAYVSMDAVVEVGAMLMVGAIVDTRARVGEFSVLWPGACVNHDSFIGENTFLSPGTIVCGNARVGSSTFVGAGANILDGAIVPENSYIKAGTLFFTPR